MPAALELSQLIGLGGWGWPISSSVSQKIVACLQLRYKVLNLALVLEATTNHKIAQSMKKALFNLIGFVGSGFQPMKKFTHVQLCAFDSDKYDALE
jgi:hypothetical protein